MAKFPIVSEQAQLDKNITANILNPINQSIFVNKKLLAQRGDIIF